MKIGARGAPENPSVEKFGAGARVHGLPDTEVERDLHTTLGVVVGFRDVHPDGDPLRVGGDFSHVRDAVGTPEETDELLGQTGIT